MNFKKRIIARIIFGSLTITLFLSACEWSTIEPIDPTIPDNVSFSQDIQPIFTKTCVACHPPTEGLDLTEGKAYNNIINNVDYINLSAPEQSLIYKNPAPNGNPNHPGKYTTTEAATVLSWIEAGAKNN